MEVHQERGFRRCLITRAGLQRGCGGADQGSPARSATDLCDARFTVHRPQGRPWVPLFMASRNGDQPLLNVPPGQEGGILGHDHGRITSRNRSGWPWRCRSNGPDRAVSHCWRSPAFVGFASNCVKSLAVNDGLRGFSAASALKAVSWDPVA